MFLVFLNYLICLFFTVGSTFKMAMFCFYYNNLKLSGFLGQFYVRLLRFEHLSSVAGLLLGRVLLGSVVSTETGLG